MRSRIMEDQNKLFRLINRLFGWFRSWIFEVTAVLGLALAANLIVARATSVHPTPALLYPVAAINWTIFGIISLYFSKVFMEVELYHRTYGEELSKILIDILDSKRRYTWLLFLMMVCLGIGVYSLLAAGA